MVVMDKVLTNCLRGQKWAWDAFVQRYAPVIMAAIHRILSARGPTTNQQIAEDICQDVFVRLIKNDFRLLRSYDPTRASLSTWLTIISRSSAIDFLRRRQLPTVPLDQAPVIASPTKAPEPSSVAERLPVGLLSPRQKLILKLIFDRQMDTAAIAKLLGISAQTVRSTKNKAIDRLRKHFNKHPNSS